MASLPVIQTRPDLSDAGERLSIDALRALQLARLQATLRRLAKRAGPAAD